MKRFILLILSAMTALYAECTYLPNQHDYTLLPQKKQSYVVLAQELYEQGEYTRQEIQVALGHESDDPLSLAFRLLAYDELANAAKVCAYGARLSGRESQLKGTALREAVADVLLRIKAYDRVLSMLPRNDVVMMPSVPKRKAYFYRAMAIYLKTGRFSDEFEIAKGDYAVARDIYYKGR